MWTAKGRTKSVHNSEVSTLVKLAVARGHRAHRRCPLSTLVKHDKQDYIGKTKRAGRKSVHSGGVSTVVGCPQGEVLL